MIIRFANKTYDVRAEYSESKISESTKKELSSYRFDIKVSGKENFNLFKEELEKLRNGGIQEIDSNEKILREFKMDKWSYRYHNEFNSEDTIYMCTVWIEEIEKLYTSNLIIEGISVEVLDYNEEFDKRHNAIIIHTTIKITDEDDINFIDTTNAKKYFSVERPQISQDILEMRFGKTIWSQHEGFKKRNVVLVEKIYDENDDISFHGFLEPEMSNIKDMLAQTIVYTDEIIRILNENNIQIDKEKIKNEMQKQYKEARRGFWKVEDAEEYSKKDFKDNKK